MSNPPQRTSSSADPTNSAPRAEDIELAARREAGALLRQAREAAGRSVAELATQLKVTADKIAALEAGDWASLHDAAHARGLLRAAAKAVQADPAAVLRPLPPAFVRGAPIMPPKGATLGPARAAEPVGTQAGGHRLVWLALLLVALALALLYVPRDDRIGRMLVQVRGLFGHHAASAPASASGAGAASASASAAPAASAPGPGSAASAGASAASPAAAAGASMPAPSAASRALQAASASSPATPRAAAPGAVPGPALNLAASASSWVQVRSNSGKVLFAGLLAAGASRSVATSQADFPLHLVVGNAAGTQLTLDGKAVDLHAGSGNVARLVLPAAGN